MFARGQYSAVRISSSLVISAGAFFQVGVAAAGRGRQISMDRRVQSAAVRSSTYTVPAVTFLPSLLRGRRCIVVVGQVR